jgi:hypothetical protein
MQNIMNNGVAYYFTENDFGWCTRCFIYMFAEIKNPGRYYITSKASSRNPIITKNRKYDKFVNNRQQDCFQYFVEGDANDVLLYVQQYQGDVELYVAGNIIPSGPTDRQIALTSENAP